MVAPLSRAHPGFQLRLVIHSSGVVDPGVDLLVRVHVARPHVPVFAVSVGMDLPRTTATTGGATVSFSRVSLAFAWVPLDNRRGPNRLRGLLGVEASTVAFAGHGFDQSAGGRRFVAAGTAGLDYHHALGAHAFFFTALDFAAPLRRERYYFTESDGVSRRQVFTTAPVTARIVAGGGLGF